MKNLDDFTDFEDGKRHGWENDIGSLDGILKTEEGPEGSTNTFWSGKLECRPTHRFMPSLAKIFTLPGSEQEKGKLDTSFRYRIYPPEPGETTDVAVIITADISLSYGAFRIDQRTPIGKWLQSEPLGVRYTGNRPHIVIGTDIGDGTGVSRKVDIDDIKVVQIPDKK